jgi:hypothetical protein
VQGISPCSIESCFGKIMKKMTYEMALSNIRAKFSSGNNIGVERATVTAEEWEAIDAHLAAQREGEAVAWDGDKCTCPVTRFNWTQDGMEPVPQSQGVPNEYVRFEDFAKLHTAPPHPRVEVTEEMVDRACEVMNRYVNACQYHKTNMLRAAIEAALRVKP